MSIGSCRGKQQLKASVTHCRGTERERERERERVASFALWMILILDLFFSDLSSFMTHTCLQGETSSSWRDWYC